MLLTDPDGLTAADYAALYGRYAALYSLHSFGALVTRSANEFAEIRERGGRSISYVDYPCLLLTLESGIPPENAPLFTIPPPCPKVQMVDPVNDPNELWSDFAKRIMDFNFDRGPKIERASLSEDK